MRGARNVRVAWLRLDIELFHHPVLDKHRIAFGANPQAPGGCVKVETKRLGEIASAVCEEIDMALGARRVRPSLEHEMVVDRGHGDRVDALGLERRLANDEAG